MKLIIKSMVYKETNKQKQPIRTTRRKKESKKQGQAKEPLGQLQVFQYLHHRDAKGKEKEQEIVNLFEKIMENFPNLAKEIDMQVQEAQRIPNKIDLKRLTPRHIIIKMPKLKDKERLLKAAREKQFITYRGVPIRLSADFSKETLQARRGWQEIFKVMKGRKEPITKIAVPSKDIVQNQRADKELPRQEKTKGVHHRQTIII